MEIRGKGVSGGIAIGPLLHIKKTADLIQCRQAGDTQAEYARFLKARTQAAVQLGELAVSSAAALGEKNSLLFEIHKMMLEDLDYQESIEKMITGDRFCAEYAVQETAKRFSEMFAGMDDDYMRARAADVVDVSNRVTDILLGRKTAPLCMDEPCILYAEDFTPSETAQLDREKVLALLTARGSASSHTAIFARTMGIPAVIGLGEALEKYPAGTLAGVDGDLGTVCIEPDAAALAVLAEKREKQRAEKLLYKELTGKATQTKSGRRVKLYANIGSVADAGAVISNDAEGIGLFRSEFLYLESDSYPTEERLFEAYKAVAEKMDGREVIIRTLDIGADKQAHYFNLAREENPALGMRAIRICLTRPEIFKTQLRAILRASAYGRISVMFPMISSLSEVRQAKRELSGAKRELDGEKRPYDSDMPVGIMIETPASALISDMLAPEVDFFSIGTNDLTQYTLAIDRQNETLAPFCDPRHPGVLRLMEMAVKNAKKAGIWAGICGELAADTDLTREFLDMGVDELSVAPSMVLPLRAHIAGLK